MTKPKSAAGIYQCVADGSKLGIGAVISTACNVEKAGKCSVVVWNEEKTHTRT